MRRPPPQVLRTLARTILETADAWPEVREVYVQQANQTFSHLGSMHLIMPDAPRYLADRLFSLVVDVPEPFAVVRCAAADLPRVLDAAFRLEEFSISLVPAALRSFVHHFHPAYSRPLVALRRRVADDAEAAMSTEPRWVARGVAASRAGRDDAAPM